MEVTSEALNGRRDTEEGGGKKGEHGREKNENRGGERFERAQNDGTAGRAFALQTRGSIPGTPDAPEHYQAEFLRAELGVSPEHHHVWPQN